MPNVTKNPYLGNPTPQEHPNQRTYEDKTQAKYVIEHFIEKEILFVAQNDTKAIYITVLYEDPEDFDSIFKSGEAHAWYWMNEGDRQCPNNSTDDYDKDEYP